MTLDHLMYIFESNNLLMPNKAEQVKSLISQLDGLPKAEQNATAKPTASKPASDWKPTLKK
jgi:hypothetical protein